MMLGWRILHRNLIVRWDAGRLYTWDFLYLVNLHNWPFGNQFWTRLTKDYIYGSTITSLKVVDWRNWKALLPISQSIIFLFLKCLQKWLKTLRNVLETFYGLVTGETNYLTLWNGSLKKSLNAGGLGIIDIKLQNGFGVSTLTKTLSWGFWLKWNMGPAILT